LENSNLKQPAENRFAAVKAVDTKKKTESYTEKLEELKKYNFDWDCPFFEDLSDAEFEMGSKIVNMGLIHDVYLVGETVHIEHTIDCGRNLLNLVNLAPIAPRTLKIPLALKKRAAVSCGKKESLNCVHPKCLILLAAYVYHKTVKNSYYDEVLEDIETLDFDDDLSTKTVFDTVSRDVMSEIFTDEQMRRYRTLINLINDEDLLPRSIKMNYLQLVKTLINYNSRKDKAKLGRPNLNYTFIENTDTLNRICLGQEKCINILTKILKEFGIIENEARKYVNFKELTDSEALTSENYKEEIIVLCNVHYLVDKTVGRERFSASVIKNNFPAFIMDNSKNKIFIICDRNTNIKEAYALLPQLSLSFETLKIPDLKIEEIYHIFMSRVRKEKYGLSLSNTFETEFKEYLKKNYIYSPYRNLEFVNFIFQDIIKNTLASNNPNFLEVKNFTTFKNADAEEFQDLENLVGLVSVKSEIQRLKTYLEFKKEKEAVGDKMPAVDLHMCYLGNPGTGKTTVARLMAGILFNLGFIRYNKCLEVESKDLIANVAGQTAIQTSEIIQDAMGGILFIDEAYAIADSPYGAECIATLIKAMEDYRDDLVVILAGYRVEMLKFLEINSGFKSRIAYTFEFADYTNEELLQMTENLLAKYNFTIESYVVFDKLSQIYTNARKMGSSFGNSRYVRNTVDQILRQHAINTVREKNKLKRANVISVDDVKL
jgi:AAA+ superfamily predicted ATPase